MRVSPDLLLWGSVEEVPLISTLMDKAVRQHSLYGSGHPLSLSSLEEFHRHLQTFLEKEKTLSLEVKRTTFEWNGAVVFQLDKKDNNYVQEFYVDGVRALHFVEGVDPDELRSLVAVMARDMKMYESREDDSVTLLWKAGLRNIRYDTVDVYAGDLNALLRESFSAALDDAASGEERDFLEKFVHDLVSPDEQRQEAYRVDAVSRLEREFEKELTAAIPLSRFQASAGDREALARDVEALGHRDRLAEVRDVFAEVLEEKANDTFFPALVRSFVPQIVDQVSGGNIRGALTWFQTLRDVERQCALKNPAAGPKVEEEIGRAFSPEFFDSLGAKFSGTLPGTPADWIAFFEVLGKPAVGAVLALAEHVQQETVHTAFSEFLLRHPPDDLQLLFDHLKSPGAQVVRDLIRVLCHHSADPRVLSQLRHLAVHPSPFIRVDIVRAMKAFSGSTRNEIALRALTDAHPDVRMAAAQFMGSVREPHFARPLAQMVSREGFVNRDGAEKRLTCMALGRCGGEPTLKFLAQIVEDNDATPQFHELRIAALYGIAEVVDPKSEELLGKLASRMFLNRDVKEKARQLRLLKLERKLEGAEELKLD